MGEQYRYAHTMPASHARVGRGNGGKFPQNMRTYAQQIFSQIGDWGWPEPYIHTVHDRMYGDFPVKITVCTPYICTNVWFWPTLEMTNS